jgi:hypothetical protein
MASTPNGRRGFFADVFLSDDPAWHRVNVTVEDCPAISQDVVEEFRRTHGDEAARQEFYGEFLDSDRQAFATEAIDRAWGKCEAWSL